MVEKKLNKNKLWDLLSNIEAIPFFSKLQKPQNQHE